MKMNFKVSSPIIVPTKEGNWLHIALELSSGHEHSIFLYDKSMQGAQLLPDATFKEWKNRNSKASALLLRVHSSCRFGDTFGGISCDCGKQLDKAKKLIILNEMGALLYLDQEGRDVGLFLKNEAVYLEQTQNLKTSETFLHLGLHHQDFRNYDVVKYMIKNILGYNNGTIKLMTNNPHKVDAISSFGYDVCREPLWTKTTPHAKSYIASKREEMGHME